MSGTTSIAAGIFSETIARLRNQPDKSRRFTTILAREVNNHFHIRAMNDSFRGEINADDMEMIYDRFLLAIQTILRSEPALEEYGRQNEQKRPLPSVIRPVPDQLTALEDALRDPPAEQARARN